jgi:hypothetical protein
MLFSTTYLRSRVFLSIKSPFFMFLRFNGSNKLPQKELLGCVGFKTKTVASATSLNRDLLPSSSQTMTSNHRSGLFSSQMSREMTSLNALKKYDSQNRGMAVTAKIVRLDHTPGTKFESHQDHFSGLTDKTSTIQVTNPGGNLCTEGITQKVITFTTKAYVVEGSKKIASILISKNINLLGKNSDQFGVPIVRNLGATDCVSTPPILEPNVEKKAVTFTIDEVEKALTPEIQKKVNEDWYNLQKKP